MTKNINNYDTFVTENNSKGFGAWSIQKNNINNQEKENKIINEYKPIKFLKFMTNNIWMTDFLNGTSLKIYNYLGVEVGKRGVDTEDRFIVSVDYDFIKYMIDRLKVSEDSVRRGIKELREQGLLFPYGDSKTKCYYNYLVNYKGSDEDFIRDEEYYEMQKKYENCKGSAIYIRAKKIEEENAKLKNKIINNK